MKKRFTDIYIANLDLIGEGLPVWFNHHRSECIEALNLTGIPGRKDERYLHTDLDMLLGREWENYFTPHLSPEIDASNKFKPNQFIITNGFAVDDVELHKTPEGIIYGSLRAACREYEEIVRHHYGNSGDHEELFTALNGVFVQDGAFVYIPDGVKSDTPVMLRYKYDSPAEAVANYGRTLIVAGGNSRAGVIVEHHPATHGPGSAMMVNYVREISIADSAGVEITDIFRGDDETGIICNSFARLEAKSSYSQVMLGLGGQTSRIYYAVQLDGEKSEATVNGLYLNGGDERSDIGVDVRHIAENCRSDVKVKGVAAGRAEGSFTGMAYVAPGAQHTQAVQQSRNLLIGSQSRIYAQPRLEIYADDVKCSHGASVGELDREAVYYMRQRGLDEKQARNLQLHGFVNDVLGNCGCEECCEWMREMAYSKIDLL